MRLERSSLAWLRRRHDLGRKSSRCKEQLNAQLKKRRRRALRRPDGGGYRMFAYLQGCQRVRLRGQHRSPASSPPPPTRPMPVQQPRRRHRTHGQQHDHPRERRLRYNFVSDGVYINIRDKNGTAANSCTYSAADFFFDARWPCPTGWPLGISRQRAARRQAYAMMPCTILTFTSTPLTAARAAPLLNGYAVVLPG